VANVRATVRKAYRAHPCSGVEIAAATGLNRSSVRVALSRLRREGVDIPHGMRGRPRIETPAEVREQIAAWHAARVTYRDMAERLDVPLSRVCTLIRQMQAEGLLSAHGRWPDGRGA
jgi:DNA-binding IclR family transcriptional regulator